MIIIYTSETCPYCLMAKDYLNAKKVKFIEKKVDKDPKAAEEMFEKSGQMGVPVIDINGNIVIGFNKKMIDLYLKDIESSDLGTLTVKDTILEEILARKGTLDGVTEEETIQESLEELEESLSEEEIKREEKEIPKIKKGKKKKG